VRKKNVTKYPRVAYFAMLAKYMKSQNRKDTYVKNNSYIRCRNKGGQYKF